VQKSKILSTMTANIVQLTLLSCLIVFCETVVIDDRDACEIIEHSFKRVGNNQRCYAEASLVFLQFSNLGDRSATFIRNNYKELKVQCRLMQSLDSEQIPKLNFEEIESVALEKCPLNDTKVLKDMKNNLNLKSVKNFVIESAKENLTISRGLFTIFPTLLRLELKISSKKVNFESKLFESLKTFEEIILQVYDITALPSDVFFMQQKLKTLTITGTGEMKMKSEPRKLNIALHSCLNLTHFHLSGVVWPITMDKLLVRLNHLEIVEITHNMIENIGNKTFDGSSEIKKIFLNNNQIKDLPNKIFSDQSEMETLDLSFNHIEILDDEIFAENEKLQFLDLSNNKLMTTSR
jgi:Leucine-rich repeat (LRR) protein